MTVVIVGIVLLTYVGVALGSVPRTRMNRATIALVGAAALVALGAVTEEEAIYAIDLGTLLLLGAMMVINNNLRMAGFFTLVTNRVLALAKSSRMLLAIIIGASGVLSALFLNDTICLMLTPLLVDVTLRLRRDPLPYLIGLAVATNVGSVATITGNPQNILIGQSSRINYVDFLIALGPVAFVGLVICWLVIVLIYRDEFRKPLDTIVLPPGSSYLPLLNRTLLIVLAMLAAFLLGLPIVTSACVAAGALLISRLRPGKLLALDWELLLMFSGLFVVTGVIEASGLSAVLFEQISSFLKSGLAEFTLAVGALSNIVSNVPAVLLLRPEISAFDNPRQAWLALAMASTLAGNLTLLGSAATLIVAELARAKGITLGFVAFLKVGVPVTILTLLVGIAWLTVFPG